MCWTGAHLQARSAIVITGHGATEVEAADRRWQALQAAGFDLKFVRQEPQLGTGHAVQQAVPVLPMTAWWWCSRAMCR
jgi:bifunctional UDP-N-acetylglucosamine pyrophosphorylase/glucosamine-1-phosphate N-acetyltransferase